MEQQQKVLDALKIMIEMNKAVKGTDGVRTGTKPGHLNTRSPTRTEPGVDQVETRGMMRGQVG